MRKLVSLLLMLALAAGVLPAVAQGSDNYTDEMKIPYAADLSPEDGADSVERLGDHPGSPYFAHPDVYNMVSTDTLTVLPQFKTQQQTTEWSCGVSAVLMVVNYFGKLGEYSEQTLAEFRSVGLTSGKGGAEPGSTSLTQVVDMLNGVGGFELVTTKDYGDAVHDKFTLSAIQEFLTNGSPILIGWNDWGGHWQVIIGYDTMGTETEQDDVIIVADPYDTTDHNQDGYGIYPAERFIYNFTFYNFFNEEDGNDMQFVAVKPAV